MTPALTAAVLVLAAAALGLYDCLALAYGGVECTVSRVLYRASCRHPVIPLGIGILLGHLFASMHGLE